MDKLAKLYFGDTQQSSRKQKPNERMTEQKKKYLAFSKSAVTVPGISDAMQEFLRHTEPLIGKRRYHKGALMLCLMSNKSRGS